MSMYIVTMHRWGNRYGHNYAIGAWPTIGAALVHARMEEESRGGKYDARITRCRAGQHAPEHDFRPGMFNPHRGMMSKFMLRLSINRSMAWYRAGDMSRWGAL